MDRDWINLARISDEYERGLEEFIQFVQRNANSSSDGVKFVRMYGFKLGGGGGGSERFKEGFRELLSLE